MTIPTYPEVHVRLTGMNGNVYVVLGLVARALREQVSAEAATAFVTEAKAAGTYDGVLRTAMSTVDVS